MTRSGEITEQSARALARLLADSGGSPSNRGGFRDSSFSRVRLAKAPVGGIPARVGATLGSAATCNPIIVDAGVMTVDTDREFLAYNLSESVVASTGDRYFITTNHSDGAFAIVPGTGGSLDICDPAFDALTIAELETGDIIPFVRDGCLQGAEIRECDPALAAREAAFADF